MKINNPFPISAYNGPEYFCNREKEVAQIMESLTNGRNLTLFSPRRMGKTGLIYHFFHTLKAEKYNLVYIDINGTEDLNGFINQFANAVLEMVSGKKESFINKAMDLFGKIRPQISFDISGAPQISLMLQNDSEKHSTLKDIFNFFEKQKNPCIIAIDEFQQISQYPENNTEELLRSYIQSLTNTHFIFSGSQRHLLVPMFSNVKRPFYQSTGFLSLGKLDSLEYKAFIMDHFMKNKQTVDEKIVDFILEWSKSYTFYTQYLCNKIFSKRQKLITDVVVNECIMEIFTEREMIFYNYRKLLSRQQYRLLSAIAMEDYLYEPTSKEFMKRHDLGNSSTVRKSLHALIEKEMVYETITEGKSNYQVYDVFLMRWYRRIMING